MAIPSFSSFEWLNLQPAWYKPVPPPPNTEPDYKTMTRTARFERWQPLWKLLLVVKPGFSDYEVGRLIGLKEEYESGVGRKG
jgi:hypothetical protein